MKLSVCCITYNHEKFIAKAIEGMLLQQTDFPFEIVIGEDGSTDNTRKICEEYAEKHPDKIKLLPSSGNLGMMPNFIRTLDSCTGEYKAICEGDDYWIDSYKLKKQVAFLEANKEFAICYHRVYEWVARTPLQLETVNTNTHEKDYTILDLSLGNFISTPSVVFRSHLFRKYPSWYPESPVGDYVLHMLNARHGKIHYLPEAMAVYRRHPDGAWGMQKAEESALKFARVLDYLGPEFEDNIQQLLVKQKGGLFSKLATMKFYDRQVPKANEYLKKAFLLDPELKDRWLNEDFPNLLKNLFKSRRYQAADKLAYYLNKLSIWKSFV